MRVPVREDPRQHIAAVGVGAKPQLLAEGGDGKGTVLAKLIVVAPKHTGGHSAQP